MPVFGCKPQAHPCVPPPPGLFSLHLRTAGMLKTRCPSSLRSQISSNTKLPELSLPAVDFAGNLNVRMHEFPLLTSAHLHPRLAPYLPTHLADAVVKRIGYYPSQPPRPSSYL